MKILFIAIVLALFCMSLHASPTGNGEKVETRTVKNPDGSVTTYTTKTITTPNGTSTSTTSSTTSSSSITSSKSGYTGGTGGTYSYQYSSSSEGSQGGSNSGSIGGSGDSQGDSLGGKTGTYTYHYSNNSSSGSSGSALGGVSGDTSESATDDGKRGKTSGCSKENQTSDLTEEEKQLLEDEEAYSQTITYRKERSDDCENQLAKLNKDNDSLTRQLKMSNQQITSLTTQNSYLLGELEDARDEYQSLHSDFTTITTEIRLVKKRLEVSQANITKLQTELSTSRSETLQCKSQYELIVIQLQQSKDINIQLELNLKESRTTISNLQIKIEQITINNHNCGSEKDQWKSKYDAEHNLRIASDKKIADLEIVIATTKEQNTVLNGKLERCQGSNNDKDKEIAKLKAEINDLKRELSQCHVDHKSCKAALDKKIEEYNEDEKRDLEELRLRKQIEIELKEYKTKYADLEVRFTVEVENVKKCQQQIIVIREECTNERKKCQADIENITFNFKSSLSTCQQSLSVEIEKITNINIQINQLNIQITETKYELDISRKETEEAKKQIEKCNNENANLNVIIKNIKISIEETNTKLATCEGSSSTIKIQLETSQKSLNECNINLSETNNKLKEKESIIINLNVQISDLTGSNKGCELALNKLRCDFNTFFSAFKTVTTSVTKGLNDVLDTVEGSNVSANNFVEGHDLTCKVY